jgi:Mce-associated membrane protein
MTPEKRPPRRPVVGSRNPTGRPRSVAGRRDQAGSPGSTGPAEPEPTPPLDEEPRDATPVEPAPVATVEPPPDETAEPSRRPLTSLRTTAALVVALVLLVGAVVAESWYLWLTDDPVVSATRPVVVGEVTHRSAVEAASASTADILSYGYRDFDEQIEDATTKMTDSFAEQYRETAEGVKEEFVADKTELEVRVVAASVVRASSEQVQALLFLDQYVAHPGEPTDRTPYRALVTVVHTDGGWLVSDIQTR